MTRWVQVTSARGPAECCWVVGRVVACIEKEAKSRDLDVRLLEAIPGPESGTLRSCLLALEGETVPEFLSDWEGSIQWIGTSPFRPRHKRKNWFVGVTSLSPAEKPNWSENDITFETTRSSGPGGQHVNKSETAVRVKHAPSGLTATAREERSQRMNRKLALARLSELMAEEGDRADRKDRKTRWNQHNTLERGNPVRVYRGAQFRRQP